ncbi:uracil-DNA glycosylase family protein [Pedobacter ghigonis]|uniref:hypothetical protein n=1 Tax=Pedobacter ghigonis TaxID=2730403 RepID=UPI00158A17D1|nr:hypothetical protein [Pedobacter ghigonis]
MPQNEIETHPYLQDGLIPNATKLILGSFPVYECTDDDNPLKKDMRLKKGSQRFFYGSSKNKFWEKYSNSLDSTILRPWDRDKILISLKKHQIAISDTIISCDRFIVKKGVENGLSSEDSALHNIVIMKTQ